MNVIYKIYFLLPNFARFGFVGKIVSKILERTLKSIFDAFVMPYLWKSAKNRGYGLNTEHREKKYIVSLTTFPARIEVVWVSIECLLRQSYKPDKIILWLAKEQFPDRSILPQSLIKLKERGLSIEFCEDLRSHKKYYFCMQKFPDCNIITADDDIYYDRYFIENLVKMHRVYPEFIAANRVHKITFNKESNKINPYRQWKHNSTFSKPSLLLAQTNGGGVLYPPGSLPETAFDIKLIKELSPNSDDVWLKMMAVLHNALTVTNKKYNKMWMTVGLTHESSLMKTNSKKNQKDVQIDKVMNYFNISKKSFGI